MWVPVMVDGFKYTILMKDYELVGEDSVLTRELRRRMPAAPDLTESHIAGAGAGDGGDGGGDGADAAHSEQLRMELLKQISEMTRGRGGEGEDKDEGPLNATDTRSGKQLYIDSNNQTNTGRQQVEEDRRYKAYVQQPDDGVVESFAIQMIEQAIYSVQYRLNEAQHYIRKYDRDVRFRMGYIFKQLEWWIYEMEVMYSYITNYERKNLKEYNVNKNLIYYSHLVRKNFDITYTIYHLLEIHTEFYAVVSQLKQQGPGVPGAVGAGFERPDHRDIDINDPDNIAMFMNMNSDQ